MRITILSCLLILSSYSFSQNEFQFWTRVSADGDVIKRLDWSADLNNRFGATGLETFFPQVGLEYKVKKWFRPSIEYRYILDKNKYGNFLASHRINFNANLKEKYDRFTVTGRVRYQYALDRFGTATSNPDFDQAFRFRAAAAYDIKGNMITPKVSSELFYDPQFGPKGPGFTKIRIAIAGKLELSDPHSFSFKYILDAPINDPSDDKRHVIALSYGYSF